MLAYLIGCSRQKTLARLTYILIFYLALPLIVIRLLWRSLREPAYRTQFLQRFGFISPVRGPTLWVHAVSAGETIASVPLVKQLLIAYPDHQVLVTNMTPTGRERVLHLFADEHRVRQSYAPYDIPGAIHRFLRRVKPEILLIIDTELWPNWLAACRTRKISTMLVNGRLSQKSARGYARLGTLTKRMLSCLDCVTVQAQSQAQRFLSLGLEDSRLHVTGSIKFDLDLPGDIDAKAGVYRELLGAHRMVLVAGSTHKGEEEALLNSLMVVGEQFPETLLVLAPRHPHRFAEVRALLDNRQIAYRTLSSGAHCETGTTVFLVDTLGELLYFYAAADMAFVGGSLVPVGGHNLMEAAAFDLPILMGPYLHNVDDIAGEFEQAGAMRQVTTKTLAPVILALLKDNIERMAMGEAAGQVMARNRGALDRTCALVDDLINKPS